jgi:hypothetical protein
MNQNRQVQPGAEGERNTERTQGGSAAKAEKKKKKKKEKEGLGGFEMQNASQGGEEEMV